MEREHITPQGVSVFHDKNENIHSFCLCLYVRAGSLFETKENNGISHFFEHIVFKNIHYQMGENLYQTLDRCGLDFNASTYEEFIQFIITGAPAHFEEAAEILTGIFEPITLPEEVIDTERKRIKAEIREEDEESSLGYFTKKIAWKNTSLERTITGKKKTLDKIKGKQLRKFQKEVLSKAIISEVEFLTVQDLLKYDGRASSNTDTANLFSGVLICADCKAPMIKRVNSYKGKKKVFYICQTKNKSMGCSRHSIEEETLKRIVFKEIKKYLELMASYSEVAEYLEQMNVNYEQVVEYDSQIATLQTEYNRYYGLKSSLFADLKEGLIDKKEFDEFHNLYERKCSELEGAIAAQKKIIKDMFQNGVAAKSQLEKIKETLELQELDRELLVTTVRKIYVHEDKRLEIEFRFSNEMDKLAVMSQMCHEKTSMQEVI